MRYAEAPVLYALWVAHFPICLQDLRIWTIFRAEVAHYKTQHVAYRKTGTEWEILGDLGIRLHHKEEAKEAFLRCLDNKFSAKAWMKLLEMYSDEGDLQRSLNAAIRLTAYQHRWYQESAVRPRIIASFRSSDLTRPLVSNRDRSSSV